MEQEDQTQELEGTAALDYQLDRHCSKTVLVMQRTDKRLITS